MEGGDTKVINYLHNPVSALFSNIKANFWEAGTYPSTFSPVPPLLNFDAKIQKMQEHDLIELEIQIGTLHAMKKSG